MPIRGRWFWWWTWLHTEVWRRRTTPNYNSWWPSTNPRAWLCWVSPAINSAIRNREQMRRSRTLSNNMVSLFNCSIRSMSMDQGHILSGSGWNKSYQGALDCKGSNGISPSSSSTNRESPSKGMDLRRSRCPSNPTSSSVWVNEGWMTEANDMRRVAFDSRISLFTPLMKTEP